jgi:hypothetical protein
VSLDFFTGRFKDNLVIRAMYANSLEGLLAAFTTMLAAQSGLGSAHSATSIRGPDSFPLEVFTDLATANDRTGGATAYLRRLVLEADLEEMVRLINASPDIVSKRKTAANRLLRYLKARGRTVVDYAGETGRPLKERTDEEDAKHSSAIIHPFMVACGGKWDTVMVLPPSVCRKAWEANVETANASGQVALMSADMESLGELLTWGCTMSEANLMPVGLSCLRERASSEPHFDVINRYVVEMTEKLRAQGAAPEPPCPPARPSPPPTPR